MATSFASFSSNTLHKLSSCQTTHSPSNSSFGTRHTTAYLYLAIDNSSFLGSNLNSIYSELANGSSKRHIPSRKCSIAIVARSGGGRPSGPRPRPRPSMAPKQNVEENRGDAPLVNEGIRSPTVRLIGEDQSMLGIFPIAEAQFKAVESNLDLVMIAPEADPPVVRIMDYSKFRYEMQKKKREQQKKAAASKQEIKELKMRYNIEAHDYGVRLRAAQRFLADGDKVKVTIQFRGRELEFRDLGFQLFERFQKDVGEVGVVEGNSQMEGRIMQMFLAPNKIASKVEKEKEKDKKADKSKSRKKSFADVEPSSNIDAESNMDVDADSDAEDSQDLDSQISLTI